MNSRQAKSQTGELAGMGNARMHLLLRRVVEFGQSGRWLETVDIGRIEAKGLSIVSAGFHPGPHTDIVSPWQLGIGCCL